MPTFSPAQPRRAETRLPQASFSSRDNPQRTPSEKRCGSSEGWAGETVRFRFSLACGLAGDHFEELQRGRVSVF